MIKEEKLVRHFVFDVEADGPHPLSYNMINFGIVNVGDVSKTFLGEIRRIHAHSGIDQARAVSGISGFEQNKFPWPEVTMKAAVEWVKEVTGGQRAIFWSDNPGFDWQFWNAYVHKYAGENPAGHSARRIGDFAAGLRKQPLNTNAWKKFRRSPHNHNPVNDALGNAQALRKLMEID